MVINKIEGGGSYAWCFCTLFDKFIGFLIANNVCMSANILNGNMVVGVFNGVDYVGYEQFTRMIVLARWTFDMVYVLKVVSGYMCMQLEFQFAVGQDQCIQLSSKDVWVSQQTGGNVDLQWYVEYSKACYITVTFINWGVNDTSVQYDWWGRKCKGCMFVVDGRKGGQCLRGCVGLVVVVLYAKSQGMEWVKWYKH